MKKIKIIAHRSGPVGYPEQTIASAREALSFGADYIEIDLRFTADGSLAVTHDEELGRIFDTGLRVGELTGEEFRALSHRAAPEYKGHLLEDYLEAGIAPLLIHIKDSAVIPALVGVIEKHGYSEKTVIGITEPGSIPLLRELNPKIKILSFAKREVIPAVIALGADYIRLWEPWLSDEALVRLVKESAAELWIMSGECEGRPVGEVTPEAIEKILSFKPDGILINDVRYFRGRH